MESELIGITTTVPVEIIYAAGRTPVDLNNIFVADPDANRLVAYAEERGFPQSACAWTKGLYGAIHTRGIKEVVGVIEGDCSNTYALCEILESEGITVHPYGYPVSRRPDDLEEALRRFAASLGTTLEAAEAVKPRLDEVRAIAGEIYALAGQGRVHSGELFGALLNTSDFFGDPDKCQADLEAMLATAKAAPEPATPPLRLSCCGVPTILADLWDVFEGLGARFVDHEVPRQFALLDGIGKGMVETYIRYTYPYDVFRRIEDVTTEAERQGARGLIHYVQSFCHRQIEDRLWRERVSMPILTLEADRPGRVDERTRTRIEAFMERLG
ncbi:MAG: 2-hydroxyacyl-CoA dehydratase [Planctomycetaceae bacterium]|nr:2-hydroxyacyl-CoA dehydratase [Planctomycetaceae bacterium]